MDALQRILVIEDDAGLGVLLKRELSRAGFVVSVAMSGEEALEQIGKQLPDLLLLDLGLPDMFGQDLLAKLKEQELDVPFLVVSGMSDVRVAVEMMNQGAQDFILKDAQLMKLVVPVVTKALEGLRVKQDFEISQARFRLISETIEDVFWMMDGEGKTFSYVSPAFEEMWGVSEGALCEDSSLWWKAMVEEDRSNYLREVAKLQEGQSDGFDLVYRLKSPGEQRWIRDRAFLAAGELDGERVFVGVASNITTRKKLEAQVMEIAEQERIRIGQDIHDDLCQRLAALKFKCEIVQRSLGEVSSSVQEGLAAAMNDLKGATQLARGIARGLAPVTLDSEGLMLALRDFAEATSLRFEVGCEFSCPQLVGIADSTVATQLFRIAQELVNNAAKHADPKVIHVRLSPALGGVQLEVSNDGKPFFMEENRRKGMGLHFIQTRADALGAGLEFRSGEGDDGGTRVLCTVPLKEKINLC